MSTANAPNPQHMQGPSPTSSEQWYRPMLPYAKWAGIILLLYLIGPVIFYAKHTQEYAAGPAWQAEKRWARVNGSVVLSLLWYIPLVLFHGPLALFWTAIFVEVAHWLHFPLLAWVGGISILPPVPSSTLLRWVLAFPLAGLLAQLIEMVQPRTTWQKKRIITVEEQQEVDTITAAEEKKKIAQEKRKVKTNPQTNAPASQGTAPSVQKPRIPRTSAKPEEKLPLVPQPNSLWGNIDWSIVPDTHPLKQAVRDEATRLEAERREEERKRWLAQQQASFKNTSSPIIDSTLTPPAPSSASAPTDTADDYNWDEGEGSIQA